MSLLQRTRRENSTKAPSGIHGRVLPAIIGALVLTLALMAVACGSDADPTSTPTPLSPLSVSDSSSIGDILSQLPASEQQCIQDALGEAAYNQVLQLGSEDDVPSDHEDIVIGCLSGESMSRIVIGGLSSEFGPLSNATVACMQDSLADADLASLAFGPGEDIEGGAAIILTVLLCLNDAEAARADVSFFGDAEISVTQLRCVTGAVDLSVLLALGDGPDEAPPLEVLQAMLDCGVDLPTGDGDGPDFTSAQLQCLVDALGPDFQLGSGDTAPSIAVLQALLDCGVDIPTGGGEGHDLTPGQLQCLLDALGPDFLQSTDQDHPPTPAELRALLDCGVAIPIGDDSGGEGHDLTPGQLQCLLDVLGPDFLQRSDEGGPPTPAELQALVDCEVDISTSRNNDSSREHVDDEQKECLEDALGSDALAEIASGDRHPTADEQAALTNCDVTMPIGDRASRSDDGSSGQHRDDGQKACLEEALGSDVLAEITSGARHPTTAELEAFVGCGVAIPTGDIPSRSDDGSSGQHRDDDSPKHNLTDTQLGCLQEAIGVDALEEVVSGDRTPTFAEIQALLTCGVDLPR